jgi:hypothetical protein
VPRIHQLLVDSLLLALAHSQRDYTVRGRLVDNPSKHPVPGGVVRAPSFGINLRTDTLGTFQLQIHATPGCYLFVFQGLGYGATAVSVPFDSGAVVSLGDIPLNPAPILEYKTLYYERCRLPDSISVHNDMLGIDTVRIHRDSS